MLYSCKEAAGNADQLKLVRSMCQEQAICWIRASRQFFGKTECPGTVDAEMYLWLVYSCDDGGTDKTTTHTPTCDSSSTPPTPTTSSPTPTTTPTPPTETCSHDDRGLPWGEKVQLDVPGCDGSIDIVCDKGCIAVHKVTQAHPKVVSKNCSGPIQLSKETQVRFSTT